MLFCGSSYRPLHLLNNPPLKSVALSPLYNTHFANGLVSSRCGQVRHCNCTSGGRDWINSGRGVMSVKAVTLAMNMSIH